MSTRFCRTAVIGLVLFSAAHVYAQRSADDCASLTQSIGDGTFTGSNVGANTDGSASCQSAAGADIWWRYVAPITGTVVIDTCGSTVVGTGESVDTVISIHDACGAADGGRCNDDAFTCFFTSSITVNVTANQALLIRVATRNNFPANIVLHVSTGPSGPPVNDGCFTATQVEDGDFTGNNQGADTSHTVSCAPLSGADVWWRYRAPAGGTVDVDTCGSAIDTALTVYAECGEAIEETGCDDNGGNCGSGSRVTFTAAAGEDYFIRVAGAIGQTGNIALSIAGPSSGNGNGNANGNTNGNANTNDNTGGGNTNDNGAGNTNDNTGGGNDNSGTNDNSGGGGNDNGDGGNDNSDDGIDPQNPCGQGLCGAGTAQLMPLTILGLCVLRFARRRF